MADELSQPAAGPITVPQLFTNPEAHPVALHLVLTKAYGLEWLVWEPETLWREIELEFGKRVSYINKNKIQALRTLQANEFFWNNWEVFCPTLRALVNRVPDFYVIQPPTVTQIYGGVDMVNGIRKFEYSREVQLFMAGVFYDDGLTYAPSPLDFIQDELELPRYHCRTCGLKAYDNKHTRCESCGGSNLEKYKMTPSDSVKAQIDAVLAGKHDIIPETYAGVQAAKLKVATDYMNLLRSRLEAQVRVVL